ncbi:hypothetical protein INR49_008418, partial [Caranx melampygus]
MNPEEAGLLLRDTVFPLGQRQLGTVPPSLHCQSTLNMFSIKYGRKLPVWNGQTSIHGPLQNTEHLVACGGSGKSSIQVAGESAWLTVNALNVELVTCHLHLAVIYLIQAKLVQELRTRAK